MIPDALPVGVAHPFMHVERDRRHVPGDEVDDLADIGLSPPHLLAVVPLRQGQRLPRVGDRDGAADKRLIRVGQYPLRRVIGVIGQHRLSTLKETSPPAHVVAPSIRPPYPRMTLRTRTHSPSARPRPMLLE